MTPQINHLRKMSTVLMVSTHIYGASQDIDGKTCIFRVNLGMWPLKLDCLRKTSPVLRVSTHIYSVSKEIGGKMFIFQLNLGMWPLKWIILEKWTLFWGFQHPLYVLSDYIDGKMFIRSFVCHMIKHSVKQSMKWQVSSNIQIYPGKSDDGPPWSQSLTQSQQLYIVYSFICYPALCVVIWSWPAGQVSHIFISSANFYQFTVVVVHLIAYCCCCVRCITTTRKD